MRRLLLRLTGAAAVLVLILGFNLINGRLLSSVQDMLVLCGIYIILSVSLNIVNGLTGQFSIGHAGFMAVGGYVAALLLINGPQDDPYRIFFIGALAAGAVA